MLPRHSQHVTGLCAMLDSCYSNNVNKDPT